MKAMTKKERFLAACRGEAVDRPPVWLMRQAGRYLPEYRESRAAHDFLAVCRDPNLAADVTVQPLKRFDMDAAVIFSDILVIPEAMGLAVTYPAGGPRITPRVATGAGDHRNATSDAADRVGAIEADGPSAVPAESQKAGGAPALPGTIDIDALSPANVRGELGFVGDAIRETRARLGADTPILGFAGAPFTLACYMTTEPGKDRTHAIRVLWYRDPGAYAALMDRLADGVIEHLRMQIEAGADAVQLFDTWAGEWSAREYEKAVLPWHVRIFEGVGGSGQSAGADSTAHSGRPARSGTASVCGPDTATSARGSDDAGERGQSAGADSTAHSRRPARSGAASVCGPDIAVPRILYVNGAGNVIESMAASGADVLSVDARISLTEVRRRAGKDTRVQGNLDTLVLWSGPEKIRAAVRELVRETEGHGHIVNLGHGVLPGTPVEGVGAFVKAVQELGE